MQENCALPTSNFPDDDWTTDENGIANSSVKFKEIEQEVVQILRDSAWSLINLGPQCVAGTIVARLAHIHGLSPKKEER